MLTTKTQSIKEKKGILKLYLRRLSNLNTFYAGVAKEYLTLFKKFDIPKLELSYTDISDDTLFCHFFHYCVNNIFRYKENYYVLSIFLNYLSFNDPWDMLNLIFVESKSKDEVYVYFKQPYKKNNTIIKDKLTNTFYKLILFDFDKEILTAYKLIPNTIDDKIIINLSIYEPEQSTIKFKSHLQKIELNNDLYFEKKI